MKLLKDSKILIDKLNSTIEGDSAADNILATPVREDGSNTVQGILNELHQTKVDSIEGKNLSTNDLTDELKAKYDALRAIILIKSIAKCCFLWYN